LLSRLYALGLFGYQTALRLAAPVNPKARLALAGRQDWAERLREQMSRHTGPVAWFHAASLGEFEQGRPVIETFRAAYPDWTILLTFFSPSGYEVRKTYAGADVIAYLPFDTVANVRLFLDITQPRLAAFIKYEFWRNFLRQLRARHIPTILFSAIFRPDQLFFKPWGGWYRDLLGCFDHILVQNETSLNLLKTIGITNVTLAGDTRFDRVWQVAQAPAPVPVAEAFLTANPAGGPVLVIGSVWPADMAVLLPVLNQYAGRLRIILAPHEIDREQIGRWRGQTQEGSVLYSEIADSQANWQPTVPPAVLIIDNIGLLGRLYQYGNLAYIGGGFGRGIHNTLEAAAFGLPLFFGPSHARFQEAVDLIAEGGAFPIHDSVGFDLAFGPLADDADTRERTGQICHDYVARNIGATAQVMKQLVIERMSD
jgi:3-deoxy-D-manno-octulosonic-acid transferase